MNQTLDVEGRREIEEFLSAAYLRAVIKAPTPADKAKVDRNDFAWEIWLDRVLTRSERWIAVTHTLKPTHPSARGSNLHQVEFADLGLSLVGSTPDYVAKYGDIFCASGAAFISEAGELARFLTIRMFGSTVRAIVSGSETAMQPILARALSDDNAVGLSRCRQLSRLFESEPPRSETKAKQFYFPLKSGEYHLLAPLFPTALVHAWHTTLKQARWSDSAAAARKARSEGKSHEHGYRDFPNLAMQSFGGSKPQNVSQLNSERGGKAYLLPSVPPNWVSRDVRPPRGESIFDGAFPNRPRVKELTKTLRAYLFEKRGAEQNNMHIRGHRASLVQEIIDELLTYVAQIYTLDSGWSLQRDCNLAKGQCQLLDPYAAHDEEDRIDAGELSNHFANSFALWLNSAIRTDETAMGDDERVQWKHELKPQLEELAKDLEAMHDGN